MLYLSTPPPGVEKILKASFPEYKGKKFKVNNHGSIHFHDTLWHGGTHSEYCIIQMDGLKAKAIPDAPFLKRSEMHEKEQQIPVGFVVVEHSYFCGKDMGITFHVNPLDMPVLPEPEKENIPWEQQVVLAATVGLKSFARLEHARYDTGISEQAYITAKAELIAQGKYLNKQGAITAEGRNHIGSTRLYDLRQR